MKPIKRGCKVWVRADKNGYVCDFHLYIGKTQGKGVEHGLGESVVHSLSETLKGKGYKIFADNFFSSVPLAKSFSGKGLGYCGTIRTNRKHFPSMTEDKKMKRGDYDYRMDQSGVSCVKWMDTKPVNFISNFHDPTEQTTVSRKNKDGTTSEVSAPTVASEYRKYMGAVDKADMLKSLYETDRKSSRWYLRIFFYFLDVSVVNAYVIHKCLKNTPKLGLKQFKRDVIAGLIGSAGFKKRTIGLHDSPGPSENCHRSRENFMI